MALYFGGKVNIIIKKGGMVGRENIFLRHSVFYFTHCPTNNMLGRGTEGI